MSDKLLANRYEIIEKIGEGGMAYVYKGKDTLLNRFVAIKILKPEFSTNTKFVDNFMNESQAAAGLTSPNIVAVYDVGNEGRIHYIVMELVTGKTLSSIISEQKKLDYKVAINIAIQILSGLSVAHKNQIIHRDVKPHNVIITEDGTAKLADFGIARPISQESIKEGNEEVMGSVHYFSPEQARGSYVDERSDIYSLGIVLYEMLTGDVPFDGENAVSVALKHINDPMPRLLDKDPSLPPKLGKIIERATEKFQSNRYSNVNEMIKDLQDIEYVYKVMGDNAFSNSKKEEEEKKVVQEKKKKDKAKSRVLTENQIKEKKLKRFKKGTNIIAIIALVALIAIGVSLLGIFLGWFNKDVVISAPSFIGLNYDDAAKLALEKNVVLVKGDDVYSQDYESGLVDSQVPEENSQIKEGSTVTVYVSKGKRNNVVPNVIGKTSEEAKTVLENSGFVLGEVTSIESSKEKGTVVDQSIQAGSTYKSGESIDIVLSAGGGDNLVEMQYLIGNDFESAKAKLEALGLVVGTITYEEVKSGESNIVTWQSIKAGYEVKKGEAIDLKLTKAPEVTQEETPTEEDSSTTTSDESKGE